MAVIAGDHAFPASPKDRKGLIGRSSTRSFARSFASSFARAAGSLIGFSFGLFSHEFGSALSELSRAQ